MSNLIGGRIGGWRQARDLTQAALAARAGLPQAAVSAIEAGRRDCSVRTVFRLAAALDLTAGRLLDEEPPRAPLSRHDVDAIARAVVSGRRALAPGLRRLADACAAAMRPTLEACAAPGAPRARRRGPGALHAAIQRYGRDQVDLILERVDRFAGEGAA
jgi:transcriptional regulator with XRE-family HTH domain